MGGQSAATCVGSRVLQLGADVAILAIQLGPALGPSRPQARKIIGATNPLASDPGTIRGAYAIDIGRNVIHG